MKLRGRIIIKLRETLLSYFLKRVPEGNFHLAEELAHEVLGIIIEYNWTLRDPCKFHAWVFKIACNVFRKWLRDQWDDPLNPGGKAISFNDPRSFIGGRKPSNNFSPDLVCELKEFYRLLKEIFDELPEEYRQLLILRFYEGKSLKEISHQLGVSYGSIKIKFLRAKRKLYQIIKRKELEDYFRSWMDILNTLQEKIGTAKCYPMGNLDTLDF